jgi:hypothetical protein
MLNVCYVTDIDTHEETIGSVFDAKYKILDRMRLACEIFGEDDRPVKRCPTTGESVPGYESFKAALNGS